MLPRLEEEKQCERYNIIQSLEREGDRGETPVPNMAVVLQFLYPFCIFLAIVKLIPIFLEFWRTYRITSKIPGPPLYPIIGSFYVLSGPIEGLYDRFMGLWEKYGATFKLWIVNMCFVVVTDPDDLEVVFTSPHLKTKMSKCYGTVKAMLGETPLLVLGDMDAYQRHRKALTTSLHFDILQDFVQVFNSNSTLLTQRLQKFADSEEVFNVRPYIGDCANLNMCETLMSADVAGMEAKRDAYVANICKAAQLMLWKGMRPWYWNDTIFRLMASEQFKEYNDVAKIFHEYVEEVLEAKLQQGKAGNIKSKRETFVEKFLQSEERYALNKSELLDETKGLMFAASDTTVQLLCFFLVIMSIHTDVQEKVHREIDDIFGSDRTRPVQPADLPRLQYLECVLKEVLRMFPVAPLMGREATADVTLPSGQIIPKGCNLLLFPRMTHRNERWFPDPLKFDPERFMPENTRGRHPFAYIPFSAGTRSCIGQKYGMMFTKTVAATLMRNFASLPDPNGPKSLQDIKLTIGLTLSMTDGSNIRLQHRKEKS